MGRRDVLIGFGVAMLMGVAVYLRLWTIDYRITSDETDLLRRQFDLASKEAMDESAEWRKRYDVEAGKANTCASELAESKCIFYPRTPEENTGRVRHFGKSYQCTSTMTIIEGPNGKIIRALNAAGNNKKKLEMLQKENMDLIERIESLKQELETEKLKCSMQRT